MCSRGCHSLCDAHAAASLVAQSEQGGSLVVGDFLILGGECFQLGRAESFSTCSPFLPKEVRARLGILARMTQTSLQSLSVASQVKSS